MGIKLHPATIRYKQGLAARKQKSRTGFDPSVYAACTPKEKMGVLEEFSQVVIAAISYGELRRKRACFDRIKNRKFPLESAFCWVCNGPASHRHHVILLRNGGSVSSIRNVVYLCEECHCRVHPWLEPVKNIGLTAADFELARAKNDASLVLEKAAKGRLPRLEDAEVLLFDILRRVFNILQGNQ